MLAPTATLADLAAQVLAEHDAVLASHKAGAQHAMTAGDRLIVIKAAVKAAGGKWRDWVKENFEPHGLSYRTCRLYMQLARHRTDIEEKWQSSATLSVNAALQSIAPEPDADEEDDDEANDDGDDDVNGMDGDEWYTPLELIELVWDKFGGTIDLDPASCVEAQTTVQAKQFFTKADDGLQREWHGRVFLNPPFSHPLIAQFVKKLIDERESGRVTEAILLLPVRPSESLTLADKSCSAFCSFQGRMRFRHQTGKVQTNQLQLHIYYFGNDVEGFTQRFAVLGRCWADRDPALDGKADPDGDGDKGGGEADGDEWYSPPELIEAVRDVLGTIDLDPASCPEAQQTVQAIRYYSIVDDGLVQPWDGLVFLNSPFSNIAPWVNKLIKAHESGQVPAAILLLPPRLLWQGGEQKLALQKAEESCSAWCSCRMRFRHKSGRAPEREVGVFYFGDHIEKFVERFPDVWVRPEPKPALPKLQPKPAPEPARVDVQLAGEPFYKILQGDVRELIADLPEVHCVITSPPYFRKIPYGDSELEIGHEATVDEYVAKLVNVYKAIPLHPQGSIFVNLGDKRVDGGLLNIPSQFSLAMQAAGFVLVDVIIWAKAVAKVDGNIDGRIRIEPCAGRLNSSGFEPVFRFVRAGADPWTDMAAIQATRRNVEPQRYLPEDLMRTTTSLNGRSVANVWLISGRNIQDEHYGCFPPELVERLVAGFCPLFVNPDGSLPRRLVHQVEYDDGIGRRTYGRPYDPGYRNDGDREYVPHRPLHMGWEPIAEGATPGIVPGIICDPFAGTGTVGEVALKMGRSFIGCELYPQHVETAQRRCADAKDYVRAHYGYAAVYGRILNPPATPEQDDESDNVIQFDEERIKALTAKLRARNDRREAAIAVLRQGGRAGLFRRE